MATPNTFLSTLYKILTWLQRLALAVALAGLLFRILHLPGGTMMLLLGAFSLAILYFLFAFIPRTIPAGIAPSVYVMPVSKVLYIGSSVIMVGILFLIIKLEGSLNMLLIGCCSAAVGLLVSAALIGTKRDNWVVLNDVFLRAMAALLFGVYFLQGTPLF